jgi:hypothetical protein
LRRLVAASALAGAVFTFARLASAVVVNPFFTGHGTIDSIHPLPIDTVFDSRLDPIFGQSSINIDPEHGFVGDGGTLGGPVTPGNWGFDFDLWGPLVSNIDLNYGGQVTYGFPADGAFAVTWVDVANANDPSVHNTFQVLFIGSSGFTTNTGFAIAPGSVIFSYGSAGNEAGTVNLSASSPEAIGLLFRGNLSTLQSLGVGDANGVLSSADLAALRASGDPFLFNATGTGGFEAPLAFAHIVGLVPEPASDSLVALALAALAAAQLRGVKKGFRGARRAAST